MTAHLLKKTGVPASNQKRGRSAILHQESRHEERTRHLPVRLSLPELRIGGGKAIVPIIWFVILLLFLAIGALILNPVCVLLPELAVDVPRAAGCPTVHLEYLRIVGFAIGTDGQSRVVEWVDDIDRSEVGSIRNDGSLGSFASKRL